MVTPCETSPVDPEQPWCRAIVWSLRGPEPKCDFDTVSSFEDMVTEWSGARATQVRHGGVTMEILTRFGLGYACEEYSGQSRRTFRSPLRPYMSALLIGL